MNNDFLYLSFENIREEFFRGFPEYWITMKPLNKHSILNLRQDHAVNHISDEIAHMNYLINDMGMLRVAMARKGFLK